MAALRSLIAWLVLCAGVWPALHAQDLVPVPALAARVVDVAGVLQPAQREVLERKLAAFEAEAGPQIVLLLVASTKPEDIAAYAYRVADQWKIGRREVGDGVLLVVARDDRRVRIEVAKALEGAIPDLAARQIIDRAITPAFKRGDYAGGLDAAIDSLIQRIRGEALPAPQRGSARASEGFNWEMLAMFLFVAVPVVGGVLRAMLGRKIGSLATAAGAGTLAWWFSASLLLGGLAGVAALVLVGVMSVGAGGPRSRGGPPIWGSGGGWGRGGGGGGGFSSGGGGDFGGGGASGGW